MGKVMNRHGFSLVELMLAMVIFAIMTSIAMLAFQTILKKSSSEAKMAENGIAGMLGLEMMRSDIAQAGFGLPWSYASGATPSYPSEVTTSPSAGISTAFATSFNDIPADSAPWPIISGTDSATKLDYLVVKSSIGGIDKSSRRWNFVQYSYSSGVGAGSSGLNKSFLKMKQDSSTDLAQGDLAVTINTTFTSTGVLNKQLVVNNAGAFSYTVPANLTPSSAFQPSDPSNTYIAYGINSKNMRMPYNRVDFYVDKSATKPASCNPGTGVLFKAVADQLGGYLNYPLLDCVGDMQIVFDNDDSNGGTNVFHIDGSVPRFGTSPSSWTADQVRSQIKNVRVYILSHDGKKDPNFTYSNFDSTNAVCVAPLSSDSSCISSLGRGWTTAEMENTFGKNDWMHYRWKVYSFVVSLKNLR
jgi:prepilin-type N-terminal cleavage/methylation domain-containing protein